MRFSNAQAAEELTPHSGRMALLGHVLEHGPEHTRCSVPIAKSELFCDDSGRVPAWVALEYMAQCAAVHGGLEARARGEAPRPGFLVGSRRLVFRADTFSGEQTLEVSARPVTQSGNFLVFDCALLASGCSEPLAEGRLNVYLPEIT